jgi:hypothetical protein
MSATPVKCIACGDNPYFAYDTVDGAWLAACCDYEACGCHDLTPYPTIDATIDAWNAANTPKAKTSDDGPYYCPRCEGPVVMVEEMQEKTFRVVCDGRRFGYCDQPDWMASMTRDEAMAAFRENRHQLSANDGPRYWYLKPCAECGGRGHEEVDGVEWRVICANGRHLEQVKCQPTASHRSAADAVLEWNRMQNRKARK